MIVLRMLAKGLLALLAIALLSIAAMVGYTRWPSDAVATPLELSADTEYLVLFFHGVGGQNEPLLREISTRYADALAAQPEVEVIYYSWYPWSNSRLRSGAHGETLAMQLGRQLAAYPNLRHVRMLVHSAGARFPDPLCEAYRRAAAEPAHIEATFIDGMSIRGFLQFDYGYKNFGKCVDYASTVFTSDGEIPGTNQPLNQAFNMDVTDTPGRAESELDAHHWPLGWYLENLDDAELQPGARTHADLPRGRVVYPN